MIHKLDVWLHDKQVGTLSLEQGRLSFGYSAQWLANGSAAALSCSLPLQSAEFDDDVARPFFAGLLPEGQIRQLLTKQLHISAGNDFALLDEIGGECAGAVTFVEHNGAPPVAGAGEADVQWLNEAELADVLRELPRRPMLAGNQEIRLSLAGAQHKLPVVYDGDRIGLPRNGSPSTHILKPPISDAPGSVVNEYFCLTLASAIGLTAAKAIVYSTPEQPVLLVKRYDRVALPESPLQRIHQEDFCQALAVVPEMKYQNEGGPGLSDCFSLLRCVAKPSAPQIIKLLDYVYFNALVGNNDAHAKNFSMLYREAAPVLAPLYDVVSTQIYPDFTVKMAMKVGSKYRFEQLQARHWKAFAAEAGLGEAQSIKRLRQLAGQLPAKAREIQVVDGMQGNDREVIEKIAQLIEQRCTLTLKRLE